MRLPQDFVYTAATLVDPTRSSALSASFTTYFTTDCSTPTLSRSLTNPRKSLASPVIAQQLLEVIDLTHKSLLEACEDRIRVTTTEQMTAAY